jgi:excisionase family DNA binding protein
MNRRGSLLPELEAMTGRKRMLTVVEAAERLNVKERYIRYLIAEGRIDIVKIGRLVRIPEQVIDDLVTVGYRPAGG